ncbi:MAG: hypothetical protein KGD74_04910 [Candidatus Lokiarchaeota archaeon]|nr:hypothetical protein [Candidatus Lokiarchaeota archaeon]
MEPEIQIFLSVAAVAIFIALILVLNFRKKDTQKVLIWILAIAFGTLMTIITLFDGIEIIAIKPVDYRLDGTDIFTSWHIGILLGIPALILLSIGTILVLYDEHTYVMWHGLATGSSLILTIINVILLIFLNDLEILHYSGTIHTLHIFLGATGLMTGTASFLFGASGQRNLARMTGYFTLAGWWGAYLLGLLLELPGLS